jgi:HEAT repeat protein
VNWQDDSVENEFDQDYFDPSISALLMARLDDPDPQARIAAIQDLWDCPDVPVMERLLDLAQHDPESAVRCKAISGLGIYVYEGNIADFEWDDPYAQDWLEEADFERVCDFLFGIYGDDQRSLDERRHAVEALSFLNDDRVKTLIEELYVRPEKEAKISALFAMGRNGFEWWLDILVQEIYNPDKDIQIEAIDAAGEMNAEPLGKDLLRLTYADDKDVMLSAVWALGQTGWEGAFERLDELTFDLDPQVRELADAAMEEWMLFNHLAAEFDQDEDDEDEIWDDESDWTL